MMRVYKSSENLYLGFRTRSYTNGAVTATEDGYTGPTQIGLYKRFVSDLVGNTEDSFSRDTAHQPAMYTFCICAAQMLYVYMSVCLSLCALTPSVYGLSSNLIKFCSVMLALRGPVNKNVMSPQ